MGLRCRKLNSLDAIKLVQKWTVSLIALQHIHVDITKVNHKLNITYFPFSFQSNSIGCFSANEH